MKKLFNFKSSNQAPALPTIAPAAAAAKPAAQKTVVRESSSSGMSNGGPASTANGARPGAAHAATSATPGTEQVGIHFATTSNVCKLVQLFIIQQAVLILIVKLRSTLVQHRVQH
jgi:hypothetical protein